MTKTITVRLRDVYGVTKAYPADDDATHFAAIAGTKTLTPATLLRIAALGYEIVSPMGDTIYLKSLIEELKKAA